MVVANKELAYQNEVKERRAAELIIANEELAIQSHEKEKRASELSIANIELAYQNQEKEKRATELVIANKELEQFSYIASHDLQEPLRTVANYMKVFEEDYVDLLDDNARKYLLSVTNAINRMSTLIKSLLDFSRLGHGSKITLVDCRMLIDIVLSVLATIIEMSKADIQVSAMPQLYIYETEVRQVFQNLIANAIKFRKKNTIPEIRISSERVGEDWKFSVSDNGIGISPAYFERVFDIFQRLNPIAEFEGNGIGLSNCKKIVQSHKGRIWVEANKKMGSTFHFTIPDVTI